MSIHCVCPNGHALRVKDKLAGREATCPTCQERFTVPQSTETAMGEAIEWRMTTPDGGQRGPTVPLIFAQWIAAGEVGPETPVWRTGWEEWRPAGEVADQLPAPLGAPAKTAPTASPKPPQRPKPSAGRAARPATYADRRTQRARRRRRYSLLLLVACVLLTAMLAFLLVTGPPAGGPVIAP